MNRKYSKPQKRGELFEKLLSFFRSEETQFLRIEMPRACKSYPYVAMDRSGVKAKAVYYTLSKEPNPLDDLLCWTITKTKHETPEPKANAKPKADKEPKKAPKPSASNKENVSVRSASNSDGGQSKLARRGKAATPANVIPIAPTKGVDITQLANV